MATSQGTWESNTGLGVQSHYGARGTDDMAGTVKTEGVKRELRLVVDGTMLSNQTLPVAREQIPAGAYILDAHVVVETAFALGGTTPTMVVGTDGSEATNGFSVSEANMEAAGTYEVTSFNGTWASELAAATTVNIAMGGTSPTSTNANGRAVVIINYILTA